MATIPAEPDPDGHIGYADWGVMFFTHAVSIDRVLAGVNVLSGQPVEMGPMGVGPGRLVKVVASGRIGVADGKKTSDSPVAFRVELPVALEFTIDLGMDKHTFVADIVVPLALTARAREDLAIVLEVEPPHAREVLVDLRALGRRASITKSAADVGGELRRFVAKYVARELEKDYVREARTIDVSGAIDKAMTTLGPRDAPIGRPRRP
jgi:hypothetical protein